MDMLSIYCLNGLFSSAGVSAGVSFLLLSFLMSYPGKAFSRNELLEGVFPDNYEGYDRNVDNYVKQIRKKLAAESGKKEWIETVHGVGYRFTAKEE